LCGFVTDIEFLYFEKRRLHVSCLYYPRPCFAVLPLANKLES
jgi:hypothetical protein